MSETIEVVAKQQILGKEITVYGTAKEPLVLAKDVAKWIDHSDVSTLLRNVDDDEKVEMTNPNNVCGGQKAWFLTENGVYEVLMQSRKPIAKTFKKEVKRVLHDLRVNGTVISTRVALASPEEQAVSFQKALDSAVQHAISIAEAHFQPQIDQLNREKAWISDKKTATAMQTASVLSRRNHSLEAEKRALLERIDEIDEELGIQTTYANRYWDWRNKVGRPPKGYVRPSDYADDELLF